MQLPANFVGTYNNYYINCGITICNYLLILETFPRVDLSPFRRILVDRLPIARNLLTGEQNLILLST